MKRIIYNKYKIDLIRKKLLQMLQIISELEKDFPERHFTMDGHLIGSIGEVMAAYYYGIDLYKASTPKHDGIVNGREVQIKITQQDTISINEEPEYLIVLYLTKTGDVYEVYNGRGKEPWNSASKVNSHRSRHMRVNKLMKLNTTVPPKDRISPLHKIEKMKKEYKNHRTISKLD